MVYQLARCQLAMPIDHCQLRCPLTFAWLQQTLLAVRANSLVLNVGDNQGVVQIIVDCQVDAGLAGCRAGDKKENENQNQWLHRFDV